MNNDDSAGGTDGHDSAAVHRHIFDPTSDDVSTVLLEAISSIEGVDSIGLDTLAESVDPDALTALFQPRENGTPRDGNLVVAFTYNGYRVFISEDGLLSVYPTTDSGFQAALEQVVNDAQSSGIDVRGAWTVTRDDDGAMWDIQITNVQSDPTRNDEPDPLVRSILDSVAREAHVDPSELPPFSSTVDRETVESLTGNGDIPHPIQFQYYGYEITVHPDGTADVE